MRHSRQGFKKGPKRLSDWGSIDVSTTIQGTGVTVLLGSLNATALAMRPFTVVRTYLQVQLQSDQSAAIERQFAGVGMCVVSDQASAIGVTAVPTPILDLGSDLWLLHQLVFADESNLTDRTRSSTKVAVDSKAMRKVNNDEDLIVVMEVGSPPFGGVTLDVVGRFLVKLH